MDFGKEVKVLHKALDFLAFRNVLIASNIANVETPGYKAKDIRFLHVLEHMIRPKPRGLELRRTNPRHIPRQEPPPPKPVVFWENTSFGTDGNSVDLDHEMMKLTANQIEYRAISQFIGEKFRKFVETLDRMQP